MAGKSGLSSWPCARSQPTAASEMPTKPEINSSNTRLRIFPNPICHSERSEESAFLCLCRTESRLLAALSQIESEQLREVVREHRVQHFVRDDHVLALGVEINAARLLQFAERPPD